LVDALPLASTCATIVAMATEPLRTVRDKFSKYVDRVEREHERVVVTRNGRPAAVLINPDDLQSLEETLAILADPETLRGIREGQDAIRAGDFVEGSDAIAALRPRR
jgi:antitoxin YefM